MGVLAVCGCSCPRAQLTEGTQILALTGLSLLLTQDTRQPALRSLPWRIPEYWLHQIILTESGNRFHTPSSLFFFPRERGSGKAPTTKNVTQNQNRS